MGVAMAAGDNRPAHVKMRTAREQAAVLRLRREGVPLAVIAADPEVWGAAAPVTTTKVNNTWRAALRTLVKPEADLQRARQGDEYDALRRVLWGIVQADHVVVSGGTVVRQGAWVRVPDESTAMGKGADFRQDGAGRWEVWDGNAGPPLRDHGPVLDAADKLRKLLEAEARLFGLNLPVKVAVEGDVVVTYRIEGVDPNDVK